MDYEITFRKTSADRHSDAGTEGKDHNVQE